MAHQLGDKVTVYFDPLTEQDREGIATLVKEVQANIGRHNGRILKRWKVKFRGETHPYERNVLDTEVIEEVA
jgi:hypothetical protein